jgi:hypothetical protein
VVSVLLCWDQCVEESIFCRDRWPRECQILADPESTFSLTRDGGVIVDVMGALDGEVVRNPGRVYWSL